MSQPSTFKWRTVAVVLGVVGAAVAGIVFMLRSPDQSPQGGAPIISEPPWVKVVLPPELVAGSRFSVSYEPRDPATDPRTLGVSPSLNLWRGNERLNVLITAVGEPLGEPRVESAKEPTQEPAVRLGGSGPFYFRLPDLKPGVYVLCGGIGSDTEPWSSFCRSVRVRAA